MAPEQMAAPTVVGTDSALEVSWTKPHNEGSPIHTYTVFLTGPGGGQPIPYPVAAPTTSLRIAGLENGKMYTVTVQAQNKVPTPSPASSPTECYPHGKPDQATGVSAVATGSAGDPDKATVEVRWKVGSPNGKGWGPATVSVNGVDAQVQSDAGRATLVGVQTGSKVSASVTLTNSHGDTSDTATTYVSIATTPAPIANPTLSGTGKAGELKVTGLSVVTGRGFDASDLTLRYSDTERGCAGGTPISDGAILPANGWQAKTYYFCQTGIGVNNQPASSPVASATGTPTGAPSNVHVWFTGVNSTSVTVRWDPVTANPAVTQIRVTLSNGETKPLSGGATEATFSDLAQGTRYQATVVAVNDKGETVMSDHPETFTKLDVSAQWVETCHGDESGFSPASCHTFTLSAPGWSGSSSNHMCTVRNEKTGGTERVRIDGAGPFWTRAITLADSEDDFKQRGSYLVECRPE